MKVEIPNHLVADLQAQIALIREKGGSDWDRTPLGIFYSLLVQETHSKRRFIKSPRLDARANRKAIRNRFRSDQ